MDDMSNCNNECIILNKELQKCACMIILNEIIKVWWCDDNLFYLIP